MPLINCKIELSLKWVENCILTVNPSANDNINQANFKISDAKLYVPIVTSKTEDNAKLSKLLSEGFKRSIYWNEYKNIDNKVVEIAPNNGEKCIKELLDSSWQGVKRLFVLAYNNTEGNDKVFYQFFQKIFSSKS